MSTGRQSGRQRQREKQAPRRARSQMWDSIPGRWDHDLSRRQLLNQLSHSGVPVFIIFKKDFISLFERGRERERAQAEAEGKAGSPPSKEPDVGLDPRMLGS